jgi:hypothetical protein
MSEDDRERNLRQLAEARAKRLPYRTVKPDASSEDDDLIPDVIVAKQRYQVHLVTLARWDANPAMGFPPAIKINGRKYRRRGDLRAFEKRNVVRRASEVA